VGKKCQHGDCNADEAVERLKWKVGVEAGDENLNTDPNDERNADDKTSKPLRTPTDIPPFI
jgi:hypothetical protein